MGLISLQLNPTRPSLPLTKHSAHPQFVAFDLIQLPRRLALCYSVSRIMTYYITQSSPLAPARTRTSLSPGASTARCPGNPSAKGNFISAAKLLFTTTAFWTKAQDRPALAEGSTRRRMLSPRSNTAQQRKLFTSALTPSWPITFTSCSTPIVPLAKITHQIKGATARAANLILTAPERASGRTNPSITGCAIPAEWQRIRTYIEHNPVARAWCPP